METTGSLIADGSTLTVAGETEVTGRGCWQKGVQGIVCFKFCIKASKLADGSLMKIGIVGRSAKGKMQTVFVLKPDTGMLRTCASQLAAPRSSSLFAQSANPLCHQVPARQA